MAPISATQIAILGGFNRSEFGDVVIFDTNSKETEMPVGTTTAFKFNSYLNPCAMAKEGQVIGLAEDSECKLFVVSYVMGESEVRILSDLGVHKPKEPKKF